MSSYNDFIDRLMKKYGLMLTDPLSDEIGKTVDLLKNGHFQKALKIWNNWNTAWPEVLFILKQLADILVCLEDYDNAIIKYKQASRLYEEDISGEFWDCEQPIYIIQNRFKNPQKFREWVNVISRGSIPNANL